MMDWDLADSPLQRSLAALNRYAGAPTPDEVFLDDMRRRIDAARRAPVRSDPGENRNAPRNTSRDTPRVLLLGYSGAGNTGADLRTIETIAQLRRLLAPREPRITLFALGDCFDHPLLAGTPRLMPALPYLPDALDAAVRDAQPQVRIAAE